MIRQKEQTGATRKKRKKTEKGKLYVKKICSKRGHIPKRNLSNYIPILLLRIRTSLVSLNKFNYSGLSRVNTREGDSIILSMYVCMYC